MSRLLEVQEVDVAYGDVRVLWGVSLSVAEGEIVALVGANGAGKTTLLRAVSGLVPIERGQILFDGRPLNGLSPQRIVERGVVHVPEGRRLFSLLSVTDNLRLGAYIRRARVGFGDSLGRAYGLFPVLQARKNQKAGSLSGGEQQMLAIARALMSGPRLLMLDEPSLGLSPIMVKKIFELIRTLNDQGVTVLLVEQNVTQTLKIAHRAFVLKAGRVVAGGRGEDLLHSEEVRQAYLGRHAGGVTAEGGC